MSGSATELDHRPRADARGKAIQKSPVERLIGELTSDLVGVVACYSVVAGPRVLRSEARRHGRPAA